jgi:RNA polymerase sigma factor (sigma-70 family)
MPPPPCDFDEFFQAHHLRLSRALYLLCGSAAEADDLAQEAFVRAYERWPRVGRMASPEGYVFRTAMNLHRSRLRWLTSPARQLPRPRPAADPAEVTADRDHIDRALAALPLGQRAALLLVEWVGMDQDEAAAALGLRPGSLRSRLSRARAAVRAAEVADV